MSYFLAIDAGGSKTQCLLADETRVLARAATGTVKPMRISESEATARLRAMLSEVVAAAGASLEDISRTCVGLAGMGSPAVRAWASRALAEAVRGEVVLCGDEEIALDAAFTGGPGVLVVAGTGSNAIGRAVDGRLFGAGGWGPVLGDEGSGTWIGLEAIRAALRAHDRDRPGGPNRNTRDDLKRNTNHAQDASGAPSALLLREIERQWALDSLGELVAYANQRGGNGHSAPDFATLAPVVARCAEQGDALASDVLRRAGEELAAIVALVSKKIAAHQTGTPSRTDASTWQDSTIPVAFTGGVLAHIAPVRTAMTARLADLLPAARVRQAPVDALDGALWRARRG